MKPTDFNRGLHPTQVQMFWDKCPKAFEYRHIEGIRTPPAGAMYQGTAYHGGLEENFKHKIATGKDLPVSEVEEVAAERWDNLLKRERPVLTADEELGALKDQVVSLVSVYRNEVAPTVLPKEAEKQLSLSVDGAFPIACQLDLIDIDDIDIEHKTSRAAWSQDRADGDLQMTAYEYTRRKVLGRETPGGQFHIAVKKKRPEIQQLQVVKTPEQLEGFEVVHKFVSQAIREGNFPPRTDGWWCSEKWCGYWNICPYGARAARQFLIEEEVII
jgi:hypothetical protein